MGETAGRRPHVGILSSPGMGHLIPLAELARCLVRRHGFAVTLIAHPTGHSTAEQAIIDSLADEASVLSAPQPPLDALSSGDVEIETRIFQTLRSNYPYYRDTFKSLSPLVALIGDTFSVDVIDIAAELGVPPYIFFTMSCMAAAVGFQIPALDAAFQGEYRYLPEPVRVPGCAPVHGPDLMDPVHDRGSQAYAGILYVIRRYGDAKGILINSFEELEPAAVKALKEMTSITAVYPVGPQVGSSPTGSGGGYECLRWLDGQPARSVLYISFGSGGTLTREQMGELAWGLEISGQRFLWVVKSPSERDTKAAFFTAHNPDDPLESLPDGFLDRTTELGLVVPSWAPQMQVLGHASTGGFMTHCGWNSTLESITKGVPLIAWPLYAEQRINAVMLTEDVKVALRPRAGDSGLVGREEIARIVRTLMEGEEGRGMRDRMRELSIAAARALEEDGSSFKALEGLAREWKAHKEN